MTGTFAEEQIDGIPVVYAVYTDVEDMMKIRQNLEQEHERLNLALQMEMKTVACIRLMYISNDMQSYMDQLLKEIGEFMHAERAYVFELQNGCMNNTYEWCSDGVESSMEYCQNMDLDLLAIWKDFIEQGKNVSIPDVERIQKRDVYKRQPTSRPLFSALLNLMPMHTPKIVKIIGIITAAPKPMI